MRYSRSVGLNSLTVSYRVKGTTFWRATVVGVTLVALGSTGWAMPVARLRGVRPVVEIQNQASSKPKLAWKMAKERNALVFNDVVRTGANGSAELLFNNGTRIALRANSQLQILAPPDANKPLAVRVFGALSEIFVRAKGPTEIRTAAGTAAVRGTQYLVKLDGENHTLVTVTEGTVAFFNPQGEQLVHAGQQSSAVVGQAPTAPVAVDATGLLQWTFDVTALPLPFEVNGGDPNDPNQAQIVAAATALQNGDIAAATTQLQALVAQTPSLFQAQSLLSLALLQQNDLMGAQKAAQTAVEGAPQSALAHATLSMAQFFQGQTNNARRQATQALALDPLSPLALLAYSRAQTVLGRPDEARQALEQAAVLSPDLPLIDRDLGALYLSLDRLPQAEAAFSRVLAKSQNDGIALAGLATVQGRTGRNNEAQTNFDAAIAAAPKDALVRAQRAAFLLDIGQMEQARNETEAFLRDLAPASPEGVTPEAGQNVLAKGSLITGSPLAAVPAMGAVFIRLSEEALYRQNLSQAFEYGQRSVQLLPSSAPAHYQFGRVFLEQERTTQAQAQFRLAVSLDPRNARARYALGLTQEIASSGRDVTRVLGAADAASEGGPSQGLSVRNLQGAGAAERIQAAIQDPTVVRSATRSYGDTQLNGSIGQRIGGAPPGVEKKAQVYNGDISILKETNDRRGVWGLTASTDSREGVRDNANSDSDRGGVTFGIKSKDSSFGFFGVAQWEKRNYGGNTARTDVPGLSIAETKKPQVLLGFNWQPSDNASTRFLLSAEKPHGITSSPSGGGTNEIESLHGEVRHEMKLGEKQLVSLGGSWGFRGAHNTGLFSSPGFSSSSRGTVGIRNQVLYGRDEIQVNNRLTLTGEFKAIRIENDVNSLSIFDPPLPFPPPDGTSEQRFVQHTGGFTGVPTFLATYQINPSTSARVRARRLLGGIEDFELLSPRDNFLFSSSEVPLLGFGERGRSYEMELNHTFPNAAFLQLGVFQQSGGVATSTFENFFSSRLRGVRVRYEGLLSPRTTFFVSGDYNAGHGIVNNFGIVPLEDNPLSDVPKVRFEIGTQYLGTHGFFLQPTVGYFGKVDEVDDFIVPRRQRGGFTLANVRVGKRMGLRRTIYAETRNVFNKSFVAPSASSGTGDLGVGRQIVLGFSQRF